MPILKPILPPDGSSKIPVRPTATSFCDRCHALTRVTQVRNGGGRIEWLCDDDLPKPHTQRAWYTPAPNSPPPPDAVKSPALDQWIEPVEPPDLESDIPADVLDEAIDHEIAALHSAGDREPMDPESHARPLEDLAP